jgi:hypothetical protein
MYAWMLVLALGTTHNGQLGGMPPVTIYMQNRAACEAALRHDYSGVGDKGACINIYTGEVIEK